MKRFSTLRCITSLLLMLTVSGIAAESSSGTETKIRAMTEVLRARDAGNLELARERAEELLRQFPGDSNGQRLLAEIDSLMERRASAAKAAAEQLIDVEIPIRPTAAVTAKPEAPAAPTPASQQAGDKGLTETSAAPAPTAAAVEEARVKTILAEVPEQRNRARRLANAGRFDEALALIDRTMAALPPTSASLAAQSLLKEERTSVELRKRKASKQAPRKSSDATPVHRDGGLRGTTAVGIDEPGLPATDSTDALIGKGRSQYLAGDLDAAEATLEVVQMREPANAQALDFLRRIAADRKRGDERQREATRTDLIHQVGQSWQRPAPAENARVGSRDVAVPKGPLAQKLQEIVVPNVSFTRMDIAQVVAALSAISEEFDLSAGADRGVNVVLVDPAQKPAPVTITLRNASLKRILDFVTESVGYQYEVQSDAVVVRPAGDASPLTTEFFAVNRATVLRMATGGMNGARMDNRVTASTSSQPAVNVNATEGAAMKAFLQQAGVNFDATPGATLAYDGSAIIVTHTPRTVERIRNIMNRYNDVRQVEIEAKFMEVQEGALEELGVNWSVNRKATQHSGAAARYNTGGRSLAGAFSQSASNQQGSIVIPGAPAIQSLSEVVTAAGATTTKSDFTPGTESISLPIINNAPQLPGAANLAAGAGPLATIAGIVGEFDVNAVVRALSQRQGTDLLSAPRVTVLSGNPANITVAQEMRYPQSFGQSQSQVGTGSASGGGSAGVAITAGTPQEFTARNVGVELKVTPTVEEDDYSISLELNPKVTEFDGFVEYGGPSIAISNGTTVTVPSGFYQPIFSVRDISTRVTLWDGATLVMGGLTREEVKKVNDKVPVLGDLPLIGKLFRSKGESTQKRNLLIFVTAKLVTPGGGPRKLIAQNTPASTLYANPVIVPPSEITAAADAAIQ